MSIADRFLNLVKMDDDEADDDYLDDEFDDGEDDGFSSSRTNSARPRSRFFSRFSDPDDDLDDLDDEDDLDDDSDDEPVTRNKTAKKADRKKEKPVSTRREKKPEYKKTSRREREERRPERRSSRSFGKKRGGVSMEVTVIRPSSFEDTQDIANAILDDLTVILNLEGLDVDIAQRVIDFTCGVAYSLNGDLQRVSNYIFILTPEGVDISGDYESIMNGAFDVPSMTSRY